MLVETAWLAERLDDPDVVVVDMRWYHDGSGRARFDRGHIPGAIHLDWSTDLIDPGHPVAFMLASPERFAAQMERCGIGDRTRVVAYSADFGSGPHRLWWACRVYGHDGVAILDGGLEKWRAEERPLSAEPAQPREGARWTPRPAAGRRWVAAVQDVLAARNDGRTVVLDSRSPDQFRGDAVWFETGPVPADPDGVARTPRGAFRAGHIPWAAGIPATDLYRPDRTMKRPDELRALFESAGLTPGRTAITYCGVGISASAMLFALTLAGHQGALYDASWEEWGRDPDLPLARE